MEMKKLHTACPDVFGKDGKGTPNHDPGLKAHATHFVRQALGAVGLRAPAP